MRTNGEGQPVVALDVDGTLGDYHSHFLWFAEQWLGRPMPYATDINPGMRLHKFMGVPLAKYRECKLAYRQGGLKRWMPCYDGAPELTRALRRAGAHIWICTTRPYLRLDNIDPDTREWLRRNRLQYDAVLYGDNKYQELKRQAGGRVAGILEDLPELWTKADELFPNAYVLLRDQPYNRFLKTYDVGPGSACSGRMNDLWSAQEILIYAVKKWREGHDQERSSSRRVGANRDRRRDRPAAGLVGA